MPDPNFVIRYVKSPTESAAFYADLLGKAPAVALDPDGHRLRVFAPGAA